MQANEHISPADQTGASATPVDSGVEPASKPKKLLNGGVDPSVGKKTQFKPGNDGMGGGRPKGSRSLKTILQSMLEEEGIDWDKVPVKNAKELEKKFGRRGWDAIGYVMFARAASGDVQAAKALGEWSYGKNVDVTSGGKRIESPAIYVSKIEPRDGSAPAEAEAS